MQRPSPTEPGRRRRSRKLSRFVVPVAIFIIVLAVLRDQVPLVRDTVDRFLAPTEHEARQSCEQAALGASRQPDFARIIDRGEVHATQTGFRVDGIVVGEMGEKGEEVSYRFACYIDGDGNLVRTQQQY